MTECLTLFETLIACSLVRAEERRIPESHGAASLALAAMRDETRERALRRMRAAMVLAVMAEERRAAVRK